MQRNFNYYMYVLPSISRLDLTMVKQKKANVKRTTPTVLVYIIFILQSKCKLQFDWSVLYV